MMGEEEEKKKKKKKKKEVYGCRDKQEFRVEHICRFSLHFSVCVLDTTSCKGRDIRVLAVWI